MTDRKTRTETMQMQDESYAKSELLEAPSELKNISLTRFHMFLWWSFSINNTVFSINNQCPCDNYLLVVTKLSLRYCIKPQPGINTDWRNIQKNISQWQELVAVTSVWLIVLIVIKSQLFPSPFTLHLQVLQVRGSCRQKVRNYVFVFIHKSDMTVTRKLK